MGLVIGIDAGISTTKIVSISSDKKVFSTLRITAGDPVSSLYGAFGKYLYDNSLELKDIDEVILTGVGAEYVKSPIFNLPTSTVVEFMANGLGAHYESGFERMIVVSMGTGTSLVEYDNGRIEHIGGIGIGGGTLQGLSRVLLNTGDILQVIELAKNGNISNINLLIGDISKEPLPNLPMDATASLFGKAKGNVSREDIALGIICLALQSIGSSAVLSSLRSGIIDFVLIGNLTLLPQCKKIFPAMEKLYNKRFHIPKHSEYCTAIGAALSYFSK